MNMIDDQLAARIKDFVDIPTTQAQAVTVSSDPFWQGLRHVGTELWLDTGDIDAAAELWNSEFSALTTNNTLLNKEVQKGVYDEFIGEAAEFLQDLDAQARVVEIAFILNARHALRLVNAFGGDVSVELHTDLAHDVQRSLHYARRFHDICPTNFIIKVPLTPAGLITTRQLREDGIRVNFTLGFSARQNAVAVLFAKPSYVNVFLGRVNAYAGTNDLGDGNLLGERTTLASQRTVDTLAVDNPEPTKQIAASMRGGQNVADLAGVDVFTMPTKVAQEAKEILDGNWESKLGEDYETGWSVDPRDIRADTLTAVTDEIVALGKQLDAEPPASPADLVERTHAAGLGDLFPRLSQEDLDTIAADGKVPDHAKWAARIKAGELAIDTLLNLAGLASFAADQRQLDDRIRGLLA